jgi:hypothetical protein
VEDERERAYKAQVRAKAEVDRIRGDFLAEMIDLEAHIDRAIVFFFAPDEWHLFIDVFIEKMGFAGKVDALRKMLRKVDAYSETNKGLCNEIDELRVERNKFAHMAFEFVGNSYMSEGGNYELYRKERLDPGPRVEDVIHLSDLRSMVRRAHEAERQMLLLERWITEVGHVTPTEYFVRPGWDPLGLAGPPTGNEVPPET